MSSQENTDQRGNGSDSPVVVPPPAPPRPPGDPRPPGAVRTPPLPPPRVDMMASREMQEWIARLEAQSRRLGVRNKYLAAALGLALLLLLAILWAVHHATVGAYAALDNVQISHDPANQAKVLFTFRVTSPGKVYYRRTSGDISTDLIDYFHTPGDAQRAWSWAYEPGRNIEVALWARRGLVRQTRCEEFPTTNRADIVFLIDTTGSMSRSIAELQEKCLAFSEALGKQALVCRFALLGFGDARQGPWLDKYDFTSDVGVLRNSVAGIKRFDGGDLPESALDALEQGMSLSFTPGAMRLFYLVTDAPYHDPARSGASGAEVARRLQAASVLLYVFSRREFQGDYARLIGESGRFQEIGGFGKVLSEGCILED